MLTNALPLKASAMVSGVHEPMARQKIESELRRFVESARALYLRVLDLSDLRSTAGACFYACALLKLSLEKFGGFEIVVRGGGGDMDGGYLDVRGTWHGHYWIEAARGGSTWVVDITADQFGAPGVIILPIEVSRRLYQPGDQALVDEHVANEPLFADASDTMSGQAKP